jgi:CRISPR-associated protein (TIGR03984 family)
MIGKKITVDEGFSRDPLGWLAQQAVATGAAGEDGLNTLLLHCADGVTWGKREGQTFRCSHQVFPYELDAPTISAGTILQARVFGPAGEIFVWRAGEGFAGRRIMDEEQKYDRLPDDETYWLWGTGLLPKEGFTLLNEGQQGFRHAPPVENVRDNQRVGLVVRHYIEEDDTGWARMVTSRLVGLKIVEGGA